jgi:hypothetical protein
VTKLAIIVVALVAVLVSVAPAQASYHGCGLVEHNVKVKAGQNTSCAFARRAAVRLILRQSCYPTLRGVRSPVNGEVYYIGCLGIARPSQPRRTVVTYGGRGDHGSSIRVLVAIPGWVN